MQKIFYNAKIFTFDNENSVLEAMLVNDENIVFVGKTSEVLSMKTEDTLLYNLDGKTIFPSFFNMNISLYNLVETKLKNAKQEKFIENNSEIDVNYDKFKNYQKYKTCFLKVQEELICKGISTVIENNLSAKSFTFFKKLSEEKLLKLDIIGFIDIINFKFVMDDNCKSYRKYKNHFRIGGYNVSLDGNLFQKKAWLLASYPHEGKYRGSGCLTDENLSFLIKSVLDEKKQLIVSASGDAAVCQFIRCFEENIKEKSEEDLFRPILKNPFVVSKTQLKILKKNHVSLEFNIVEYLKHVKDLKREFGLLKFRSIMPIKKAKAQSIKYLFVSGENDNLNSLQLASICKNLPKQCLNRNKNQNNLDILKELIETSAYYSFDEVNKGSLENGMLANFVILENFDIENLENSLISETFFYGESIYKYKQKKKA